VTPSNKHQKKILQSITHYPKHIAIIQDGNRRYAQKKGISIEEGHRKGAEKTMDILTWATDLDIPHVTAFAFSTENFKRSEKEREGLHSIFLEKFREMKNNPQIIEHEINISVLGDRSLISPELLHEIEIIENQTKNFHRYNVHLAIAYGGRNELTHAAEHLRGVEKITPEAITKAMYPTMEIPPVDLLIRTANESRISNFLPWLSYGNKTVFCKIKRTWPEIRHKDLVNCLRLYNKLL